MRFVLQAMFPIGLIFIPMMLVGRPMTIVAVGFALGFAMAALAVASAGVEKALSGGGKGARIYLWMALSSGALAAVIALFVSGELDALATRPAVQASVSMMPWVFWGSALAFATAAGLTFRRKRPA
jgi:hypothetical protein